MFYWVRCNPTIRTTGLCALLPPDLTYQWKEHSLRQSTHPSVNQLKRESGGQYLHQPISQEIYQLGSHSVCQPVSQDINHTIFENRIQWLDHTSSDDWSWSFSVAFVSHSEPLRSMVLVDFVPRPVYNLYAANQIQCEFVWPGFGGSNVNIAVSDLQKTKY